MKYLLLLIAILYSCSSEPTRDEIVQTVIEAYIKPKMNDPESYEFVSLKLIDSTTFRDNVEYRTKYFKRELERSKSNLKDELRYKIDLPSMYDAEDEAGYLNDVISDSIALIKIDSLAQLMGPKIESVASYTYLFSLRSTNAMGAKILGEYVVQTGPEPTFEILNITDDKDEIILNPGGFPGYQETMTKHLGLD